MAGSGDKLTPECTILRASMAAFTAAAVFLREYKDLGHEVLPFQIDVPIPEFVFHCSCKSREVDNIIRPLYHQRPGIWAVQQTDGT